MSRASGPPSTAAERAPCGSYGYQPCHYSRNTPMNFRLTGNRSQSACGCLGASAPLRSIEPHDQPVADQMLSVISGETLV